MCGIYGRIGRRDDALDALATLSLEHRGPDDAGLLVDPGAAGQPALALGHTRLAIIDLSSAGHQPMCTEERDLAVTYNGEIYNFRELRAELESEGAHFRSDSDTEVLLHLYRRHGDGMLDHLMGMFALGLWDRPRRRLLLARDPSGMKPLFYRGAHLSPATPDALVFASEIKALLVDPAFERRPDASALAGYLAYTYVPPPRSAFEGIRRVPPGCKLVFEDGRASIERFHRFSTSPKRSFASLDAAADALEELLFEVIEQHMISDVPLGAFLSGGIDSGLMVALMSRVKRERGDREPVRTYTIGFGAEGSAYDESDSAEAIARHLGVDHQRLVVGSDLASERFQHVALQFDEPFANPTALLHDALCEATRAHVTVALAGDGGDEAFGGYPRHRAVQALGFYQRAVPGWLQRHAVPRIADWIPERPDGPQVFRRARRFLRGAGRDLAATYRDWLTFYDPDELGALLSERTRNAWAQDGATLGETEALVREAGPDADALDRAMLADVYGFLPNNVLRDSDRSSMRVALEVRAPYADRRVLEFGLQLPTPFKVAGPIAALVPGGRHVSKRVLRRLAARYLPADRAQAPKQGFVAPMGTWLAGPLRELVERTTRPEVLEGRGLVRGEVVKRMLQEHTEGRRDRTWHLWSLVMLESWFESRVDTLVLPTPTTPLQAEVWD